MHRTGGFILCAMAAASCTTTRIDDRIQAPSGEVRQDNEAQEAAEHSPDEAEGEYIVQPGDTLWSIAWRFRIDVDDLARRNQLEDPDLILAGQSLDLGVRGTGGPAVAEREDSGTAGSRSDRLSEAARPPPKTISEQSSSAWQWPVRGPLVSLYGASESTPDGIGIGGEIGTDIKAAAAGQVVYAGDGLAAYGNLVIIKHDDTYLSAYGQNDELLVDEGDAVARGEIIARMGMGPERRPQVQFEIRRNGTPVDPLRLLPD